MQVHHAPRNAPHDGQQLLQLQAPRPIEQAAMVHEGIQGASAAELKQQAPVAIILQASTRVSMESGGKMRRELQMHLLCCGWKHSWVLRVIA